MPALITLVAGVPGTVVAQLPATGAIDILADVSPDGLTIASANTLNFGILIPGSPTTLNARTSVGAGKFDIHGAQRAEFTLTLTLPTELRVGPGPLSIPVTFDGSSGCHSTIDNQNSCSAYNPTTVLTARIRNRASPDNTHFVWLGGTVSPGAAQAPGVYTAVITALVQYTGN